MSREEKKKVLEQHQSPPEQTSAGMTGGAIRACSQMFSTCFNGQNWWISDVMKMSAEVQEEEGGKERFLKTSTGTLRFSSLLQADQNTRSASAAAQSHTNLKFTIKNPACRSSIILIWINHTFLQEPEHLRQIRDIPLASLGRKAILLFPVVELLSGCSCGAGEP